MNLIPFLILGSLLGGEAFISWHLLLVIDIGSYSDGSLMQGNMFFIHFGTLVGGVIGLLLWLFSKTTKRRKKIRFWLVNITILVVIYRIFLGSFIIPPLITYARGNEIIFFKIYDLLSDNYNIKDINGQTALIKASEFGNFEAANFLIEAEASLDAQDRFGFSALMSSAYGDGGARNTFINKESNEEYCKIAIRLIQYGANVNLTNVDGKNALILAAQVGDRCIVEALLKSEIDINHRDIFGRTAIEYALRKDYKKIVDQLLKAGATP